MSTVDHHIYMMPACGSGMVEWRRCFQTTTCGLCDLSIGRKRSTRRFRSRSNWHSCRSRRSHQVVVNFVLLRRKFHEQRHWQPDVSCVSHPGTVCSAAQYNEPYMMANSIFQLAFGSDDDVWSGYYDECIARCCKLFTDQEVALSTCAKSKSPLKTLPAGPGCHQ
jgi:hypothetical protein